MKKQPLFLSCFLLVLISISCSTQKDTFLSRSYNSVTTKYNILYNGNIAYQKGLDEIRNKHIDNFWKQIQIEPITFDKKEEQIALPTFNRSDSFLKKTEEKPQTPFEKAEEKAVKAIQLHSMNIGGRERNKQTDDAYLLLGKSRYYTQRFVPAIEAFNYVIATYPYASLIDETRIWRAKTNIRLDNDKLAIETLKIVLNKAGLPDKIKEQAHTALAMAYVKTDSIQNAIEHLKLATKTEENEEQFTRNTFVLGQIFASESKKDSAILTFQKVTNYKKAPLKFKIHAQLEIAKMATDSLVSPMLLSFEKLLKDREYKVYHSAMYYQMAMLEGKRDSLVNAIDFLNKSIQVKNATSMQKTYAYEKLGNLQFDHANFVKAGAYYDSVIQLSKTSTEKRIRSIRRRRKSLTSLINFETTLQNNDSILRIVKMPKEAQKGFFEKHIKNLKKADKKRAKEALKKLDFGASFNGSSLQANAKGKWYFYNSKSLEFGRLAFQKKWNNRKLADNWRFSEEQKAVVSSSKKVEKTVAIAEKYNLETYINSLPKSKETIDSLRFSRNEALFETGIIYKEQFKNLSLASKRLERLLTLQPDESLILPINYHLYKVYTELKESKAWVHEKVILDKYSTSRYAQIILKKEAENKKGIIPEIDAIYKELYYLYKENRFIEVVSQIIELESKTQDSNLIAKFDLLKAMAIGKYQSKIAYKKALEFVVSKHANSEEGKRAKEILKQLK